MTEIELKVKLTDRMERAARKAGLLSGDFVRRAIERELNKQRAALRLLQGVTKIKSGGFSPLTAEEIEAEVHAVRTARRGTRAHRR